MNDSATKRRLSPATRTDDDLRTALGKIQQVLREVEEGEIAKRIDLAGGDDVVAALGEGVNSLLDLLGAVRDETFAYQRELEGQIATIEKQKAAIRELSTPIIEVWAGVLCMPIVGVLDSARASEMTSALLNSVVEKKARFAIIDITGIEVMDTRATDHFLRMARAVRLLGAECGLSGVNPNVARTIVHMGTELEGIQSHRTLRDALKYYVRTGKVATASSDKGRGHGR
jgi:rsbT co-antagonist protein RsbR